MVESITSNNVFNLSISITNHKQYLTPHLSFHLNEFFLLPYTTKQPKWNAIGYLTYKRTYARYISALNRTEEYWETITRVVEGIFSTIYQYLSEHNISEQDFIKSCKNFVPYPDLQSMAQRMFELMWNFKFLPAGRGLWMMGTEFILKKKGMSLNNCSFISTENILQSSNSPFTRIMENLMLGVGVGSDTKGKNIIQIKSPSQQSEVFVIPDSREGWVEAVGKCLDTFFIGDINYQFDYSLIRKRGERLQSFGGVSSGSAPLQTLIQELTTLLTQRIGQYLRSVDIIDILCYLAKCVVSGNVRRSALIVLGDADDEDFITAKQNLELVKSHRGFVNLSVVGHRGMDYQKIAKMIGNNGEPAIVWLENIQDYSRMRYPSDYKDKNVKGVNPCVEMGLEDGEVCNLVESFPSHHQNYSEFRETLFFAYLYGKTVTMIPTHDNQTNTIIQKNRRMGISQSGIIDFITKFGIEEVQQWCDRGYLLLRDIDKELSHCLYIPNSIKLTTVKPSGSISLLAGVSAGIHYPHAQYYIRRIRFADNSELLPHLQQAGYPIEPDKYSPQTMVVSFPIKEKYFSKSKNDVSLREQIDNVIFYQHWWSDNLVSVTATFKSHEITEIQTILEKGESKLKSVSFLSLKENGYEQAPYETISEEEYNKLMTKIQTLSFFSNREEGKGVMYCSNDHCEEERNV